MIARPIRSEDWNTIAWLASSAAQEGDHDSIDLDWIERRRDVSRARYDGVIENDGKVVSYYALESDPAVDGFRAFIVLDWSTDDGSTAEATFAKIERQVEQNGISKVWMREMEDDRSLNSFMLRKGFQIDKKYEYGGYHLVNLSKVYET